MSEKLKILLLVVAVLGFVSVISDSGPSIQQTLGIIIAIFIFHFYLQRSFDEMQSSSLENIKKFEQAYKCGQRLAVPVQEVAEPQQEGLPCQRPGGPDMPAYVQNEQTDMYRQTALQRWPLEDWHKRNASDGSNQHSYTDIGGCQQNLSNNELLIDQRAHDHQLYRDPAKNAFAQQKMLKNARFFEKHFGQELRRAEERVWFEDQYLC